MKYTIRLPKESGEVIPLILVVHEIAKGYATRWGELPFHRDTFKENEHRWSTKIVEAAKRGELRVCDADGFAIQSITDDLTHSVTIGDGEMQPLRKAHPECEIAPGCWNFTGVDFGEIRKIEVAPVGLFITLSNLNEWASSRGDSFGIEDMPVEIADINGMRCMFGSEGGTAKVGGGKMAASTLPDGIPTRKIVEKFKLSEAWKNKLTHIKANPFLKDALMRQGCRSEGNKRRTSHLWNPVRFAEILIGRGEKNRRAMEAVITHHFADWQDVWNESMESDEADEYTA